MNAPWTSQELIAYYLFGGIADKRKLLKDEADEPLSEIFEHKAYEARDCESDRLQHCCWFCRPVESPSLRQAEPGPALPAKPSMERPARKTQLSSGSKSFSMIRCLRA